MFRGNNTAHNISGTTYYWPQDTYRPGYSYYTNNKRLQGKTGANTSSNNKPKRGQRFLTKIFNLFMLTTVALTTLSVPIIKLKYSWRTSTIWTSAITLITLRYYQLKGSIYTFSENIILDSLSIIIITLSTWIVPIINLASHDPKKNNNLFLINTMLLFTVLVIYFSINNLLIFYIIFEASLIPTVLLIIIWGYQPERKTASLYIIIYTVSASLPLLVILLKTLHINLSIKLYASNFILPIISPYISWVILTIAFMVKVPLFSLHLWLPKAHVEAPVAGSIVLAAILLKLGGYGLIRINVLIRHRISPVSYVFISIATIGAIITNTICIRQTDLKALIAYSSVGHMGLIIIRSLSNSKLGQYARLTIIVAHGLTSSLMFILTNLLYEKFNTRNIILTSGLLITTPVASLIWMFAVSINIALPPRLNLMGEITAIISSFFVSASMIILLMASNILTASYSLYIYSMINHGNQIKLNNPSPSISSINLITSISHVWPLAITMTVPTRPMLWCLCYSWNNIKLQV